MELEQWKINDEHEIEHHPLWGWRAQMARGEIGEEGGSGLCLSNGTSIKRAAAAPTRPVRQSPPHVIEVSDEVEYWEEF